MWMFSLSAGAGEILVKISSRIFNVKLSPGVKFQGELSQNQLIDLLKNAEEVREIKLENSKFRPGSWTEAGAKKDGQ